MKYEPGEDYSQWLERVRMYEYGLALQKLASGESAESVLEEMSKRMIQKGLHPILKAIKDIPTNYDAEKSREEYFRKYSNRGPVADHVIDD